MNPRTSSATLGSVISGSALVKASTNHRSPSGSSRWVTFSTWVANGSFGTQCTGVFDQSKTTSRACSWMCSGSSILGMTVTSARGDVVLGRGAKQTGCHVGQCERGLRLWGRGGDDLVLLDCSQDVLRHLVRRVITPRV